MTDDVVVGVDDTEKMLPPQRRPSVDVLWNHFVSGWPIRRYFVRLSSTTGQLEQDWRDWKPDERFYQLVTILCNFHCWWLCLLLLRHGIRTGISCCYYFRMISSASNAIPSTIWAYCSTFSLSAISSSSPFFLVICFSTHSCGNRKEGKEIWFDIQ